MNQSGQNQPIHGFWHVALMPGWKQIVLDQLHKLLASGLYHKTRRIMVGLAGGRREEFDLEDSKIVVVAWDPDVSVGEIPTLSFLQHFCRGRETLLYYFHTKGVSRKTPSTQDWRRLMEHFTIIRHDTCVRSLEHHDACGVNWSATPLRHFSGNFWWSKSAYIRTLPELPNYALNGASILGDVQGRLSCEFWIGANPRIRVRNLHQSKVNHYAERYRRERYVDLHQVSLMDAFHSAAAWRGLENKFQSLIEPIGTFRTVIDIGTDDRFSLLCLAAAMPKATVFGIHSKQWEIGRNAADATNDRSTQFPNIKLLADAQAENDDSGLRTVDVVHIDGCQHSVTEQWAFWEPRVRPGGCVLIHNLQSKVVRDFFAGLPGLKTEVAGGNGLGAWYKPII